MSMAGHAYALPDPLWLKIFRNLDARSLARAAGVCCSWRLLASDEALWMERCCAEWGSGPNEVDRHSLFFGGSFRRMFRERPRLQIGVCSDKGSMSTNRDSTAVLAGPGMVVLCHGHGDNGSEIADFVAQHLPQILLNSKLFWEADDPSGAIVSAYAKVEEQLIQSMPSGSLDNSGTSALLLVFRGHQVFVANVGGSRALLGIEGKNDACVEHQSDVKGNFVAQSHVLPDRDDERSRIERSGGQCNDNYVFATAPYYCGLVLSRTIGNLLLKQSGVVCVSVHILSQAIMDLFHIPGALTTEQEPELSCISLHEGHQFLMVATREFFKFRRNDDANYLAKRIASTTQPVPGTQEHGTRVRNKLPHDMVQFFYYNCQMQCSKFDSYSAAVELVGELREFGFFGNATCICIGLQFRPDYRVS